VYYTPYIPRAVCGICDVAWCLDAIVISAQHHCCRVLTVILLTVGDERSLLIKLQEESAPYELNYEVDYEVALVLRNHIVPNAILWYTGEAVRYTLCLHPTIYTQHRHSKDNRHSRILLACESVGTTHCVNEYSD
jgi:hypothetical protein